ncbi:hypothetical protein [uncultured Mucilaginibacter sp.]|uniref:hypothetical protein n=1 Tax=uncultured Mucilaginibacter sp. TaxID=797541 RepID=UPI0025DEE587|nr:hypothetical protein [uncultured Mucilaginibacter sp.]
MIFNLPHCLTVKAKKCLRCSVICFAFPSAKLHLAGRNSYTHTSTTLCADTYLVKYAIWTYLHHIKLHYFSRLMEPPTGPG